MPDLPVNFTDDILSETMNGRRRYRMIQNDDGTVSFEDVSEYDQVGSNFGAAQINQTNDAVNHAADALTIIPDLETISALQEYGYLPDAMAVKEVNSKLTNTMLFLDYENADPIVSVNTSINTLELTAEKDGMYYFSLQLAGGNYMILINDNPVIPIYSVSGINVYWTVSFPVRQGDVVKTSADNQFHYLLPSSRFIPFI